MARNLLAIHPAGKEKARKLKNSNFARQISLL
jgi:hypothetical protein